VQAAGDVAGLADGNRPSLGIAVAQQELGMVEQAVREVIPGGLLAQAGDGCGEDARKFSLLC
jgi:hypothetical protein